jgi:hypothetical protein
MADKPTHDAWGKPIWYPADKPYRVLATYRSTIPAHHGWRDARPQTFATEEEAREAALSIPRRGLLQLCIHKAENAETWQRNGRWKLVERLTVARKT